jgi:methionyl-tRNA formyltransferase
MMEARHERLPMPLRIIFMGTPEFSVPTLAALAAEGHEIAAVYTQPPRPAGRRGLAPVKSAVHQQAELLGFRVHTPVSLKSAEEQQIFSGLKADVAVVVAYGLLLPKTILEGTRLGCYNGHASLLPRWRGAAPLHRAIMAGDRETGMMVMKMDEGLDTGPVALTQTVPIGPDMTTGELHDKMMVIGGALMAKAMKALKAETLTLTAQPDAGASYARKIDKAETRIDFSRDADAVHNHIRGLSPVPGAWFDADLGGKRERVKVLRSALAEGSGPAGTILDDRLTVACGSDAVRLVRLQKAGGSALDAEAFLRGARLSKGDRLS